MDGMNKIVLQQAGQKCSAFFIITKQQQQTMFSQFKKAMQENFNLLLLRSQPLYVTNVDKEVMWKTYLDSFLEEERQGHNCNCCKSFVRHYGGLVFIIDGQMKSIWDFQCEEPFATVVKNLDNVVKSATITDLFYSKEAGLGTDKNTVL